MPGRSASKLLVLLGLGGLTTVVLAGVAAWFEHDAGLSNSSMGAQRIGERLSDASGVEVAPAHYGAPLPGAVVLRFQSAERAGVSVLIGTIREYSAFTPASEPPPPTSKPPTPESVARAWEAELALPWFRAHRPWPLRGNGSVMVKAAGWPFRSFYCTIWPVNNAGGHAWNADGGVIVGPNQFAGWADWPPQLPRIIPCRPIWRGVIANTLIAAVAWALTVYATDAFRRHSRRRAGRCDLCGYSLIATPMDRPCPECGRRPESLPELYPVNR